MNPPYNWCERVGLAADGAEITVKIDQMVSEVSSGDRTAAVSTPPPPPVASVCSNAPTEPADQVLTPANASRSVGDMSLSVISEGSYGT